MSARLVSHGAPASTAPRLSCCRKQPGWRSHLSGDPRFSEINLYRIAQESLNNVYKHAGASNVLVLLERRGAQIQLVIEDDVVGFDSSRPGDRRAWASLG